jgi:uncharacterized protein
MPIVQANTINPTALLVPDTYIVIQPPSTVLLNGVPTNILGIVGTAQWGPTNSPTIASGVADATLAFGSMQPRKFDLGTAVAAAALQGAANFRLIRVTDGTDVAASATFTCATAALATAIASAINNGQSGLRGPSKLVVATTSTTTLTLTAMYTGTLGNSLVAAIGPGSAATTSKLTLSLPGNVPETFDNMGVASSSASNVTLSGGTDGAATITASVLIGQDSIPRKGMYALRNTGTSIAMLADADDSTQWTTQVAFGLSEGIYMIMTGPAGDTISNAVSAKATAGIDSYAAKLMFGDWIYINDNVNNQVRLISPQGFSAGVLANLSPEQSSLNKQMFGIVGTQKSRASQVYSSADLQALAAAGIDVITNPIPAGKMFGARIGHNTSSRADIHGDNYTRMTNYIAATLLAGMGIYNGRTMTKDEFAEAKATLDNFFFNMYDEDMIGNPQGTIPWSVVLDSSNNPQTQTALGIQQANCKVQFLGINEIQLINVEGGQSVQITRQIVPQ